MLSISPIRDCQGRHGVRYYLEVVANSRDDYYAGRGEAPGIWLGGGAAALGLAGTVDAGQYLAVMQGRVPDGEGHLLERSAGRKVLGWDLTFSSPKSLSLLWAIGDVEVSTAIRRAHDKAVAETVAWLEGAVARARRGHGGTTLHDVEGLVAAGFCHRTSRAGDPQLHTHVVVANAVKSVEDHRWTGLDSRGLYSMQTAAGSIYQSALRAELAPLGLRWAVRPDGLGESADIDHRLLRVFSTQRKRIEAELSTRDLTSAKAANVAAHRVRPAKDPRLASTSDETLRMLWQTRLESFDLGCRLARAADVTGALGRDNHGPTSRVELTRVLQVLAGATVAADEPRRPCRLLTLRASTLTRAQIIRAVATAVDLSPAEVADAVDRLLCAPEVIPVLAGAGKGTRPEARRFTTSDLLEVEQALADQALSRRGQRCGLVPATVVAAVEAARPDLGHDQRAALRRLLDAGHGVEVLAAPAGCGKTFLLDAARDGWQRAGYRVIGASLAALAAAQLEAGAAIPATTVHRLLADLDRPETGGLGSDTVVVIDEAAVVGSRMLSRLAHHAARAGAKLVLCGDQHQLPEIDAGGGFRLLAERLGAITLTDNRRQQSAWEVEALSQLRDGSVAAAVTAYTAAGRVTIATTAQASRDAMVEHWWDRIAAGTDPAEVLLVAPTRADADDLGARAQARMLAQRRLGRLAATTPAGALYVGDRVIATRNDRRLGVKNGERGTIISAAADGGLVVGLDRNDQLTLPASYVAEHLRQGYGLTAHRAQGLTVEHALLLGTDTLYRELGYSALSRGKHTNAIYLTDTADPEDRRPADPIDELVERLSVSRAQAPATDSLPHLPDLGDAEQARAAWLERTHLAAQLHADADANAAVDGSGRPVEDRLSLGRYRQLSAQLHQRERLLSQVVRWQQPDWARNQLGAVPASRRGEAAWMAVAGAMAAYRERWQITSDDLGSPPAGALQRTDWLALHPKLEAVRPTQATQPFRQTPVHTYPYDLDEPDLGQSLSR